MKKPIANLNTKALIKYCSNNTISNNDLYFKLRLLNRKAGSSINEVFGYRKFDEDFIDRITIYESDQLDGLGTISFSYDEFLNKLFKILNIEQKPNGLSEEEINNILYERLEKLNLAYQKEYLIKEFPTIYDDYINGLKYLSKLDTMPLGMDEERNKRKLAEKYYYRCGLQPSFEKFLAKQRNLYLRFIRNREEYKEKIQEVDLNDFITKYFDMDKVAMYTVNSYLNICDYLTDINQIKYYMSLVEDYLNSSYDKTIEIEVENKKKLNIEIIEKRLAKVRKKIEPSAEVGIVNWELIPSSSTYNKKQSSTSRRRIDLTLEELIALEEKGNKKAKFYEQSKPFAKAYGTLANDAYIAYIYENGEILLDTYYDKYNPRTAVGNATYNLKACNFELISGLDKGVLKNHPSVKKLNHSKKWEQRVLEIISRENSEEEKEDAKELVKKLKK